ncbi:hypothetical protein KJ564_07640 [bacterium]|nr:hypothetical protein [bacterium]
MVRLIARKRVAIYLICLILLAVGFILTTLDRADSAEPELSYEVSSTVDIARSFMKDHRYNEAISLLKNTLQRIPDSIQRLPLLLLLADSYMGINDYDSAQIIIQEASDLTILEKQQKAIEKRRMNLNQAMIDIPPPMTHNDLERPATASLLVEETEIWPQVTNSFFETDLRQVLIDLSMETGIPILWDATVQGLVTYEAIEQPLSNVLKAILFPLGYTYSYQDGAYYVGSVSPSDPAFGLLSETRVMTLSNIDALEAANLLSDYFDPYVKASKQTNMICITAPPTLIDRIYTDLKTLDEPPKQILIEVIVTEISRDALREMGLDWSFSGAEGSNPIFDFKTDHTAIENPGILYNYTEIGAEIGDYTLDLMASLEALVQSGDAEIRANPRITTLNGRAAEISLVQDQYFIIQTSTSQTYQYNTLQSVSAGISLEIIPYCSDLGEITVMLTPSVGDVVGSGANDLPEISTRSAKTSIRVMDGETFTIGGLSLQKKKIRENKVPLLGDIPLLGYLFRFTREEFSDSEIVIFVTPHIIDG